MPRQSPRRAPTQAPASPATLQSPSPSSSSPGGNSALGSTSGGARANRRASASAADGRGRSGRPSGRQRSASQRETSGPGTSRPSLPVSRENEGFEIDGEADYNIAPPSYDEVINSTRYPIVRSATRASGGSGGGGGWRLDFVDFTPHLNNSTPTRYLSNFSDLVRKANTWLSNNREIELKSCETITWSSATSAQVNDTNVVHRAKSLSTHNKTKYLRGLRLWFVPGSPSGGSTDERAATTHIPTLDVADFAPKDTEETFPQLLKKVNKMIKEKRPAGRILSVTTVWARRKPGKIYCSTTYWSEAPQKTKHYAFFLRIFYLSSDVPVPSQEIGIKDFLPTHTQDSHENFTLVMDRAARWAAEQTDISLANMQAVFIKKKGSSPQSSHNRCFYTEHPTRMDSEITYYYQILRIYFLKNVSEVPLVVNVPLQITKKTFAPAMLPPVSDDPESRFESFTKTVERVSSWLDSTGAEVMCAETVPVRMHTASQQRQGPEATLVWSQPEPGVKVEDWLLFIRIYVKGEYREPRMQHLLSMPPVDWYRRHSDRPMRRSSSRNRNCLIFCLVFFFIVMGSFIVMYVSYSLVK